MPLSTLLALPSSPIVHRGDEHFGITCGLGECESQGRFAPCAVISVPLPFNSAPQSQNAVCAFQITFKLLSFTLEDSWRNEQSMHFKRTKGTSKSSIYHVKHMSIQPFTMGVNWPEFVCLMAVSIMCDICTYCVFTLYRQNRSADSEISGFKLSQPSFHNKAGSSKMVKMTSWKV